jgi:hypothetical protein
MRAQQRRMGHAKYRRDVGLPIKRVNINNGIRTTTHSFDNGVINKLVLLTHKNVMNDGFDSSSEGFQVVIRVRPAFLLTCRPEENVRYDLPPELLEAQKFMFLPYLGGGELLCFGYYLLFFRDAGKMLLKRLVRI